MSLHHELLRSRLPAHPSAWTGDGEDEQETLEDDEARDTVATDVGLPRLGSRSRRRGGQEYSPISAESSFAEALEVAVPALHGSFRVYHSPPVVKDASALSPFDPDYVDDEEASSTGTVFVCHHGAGMSGLSWARFAEQVAKATQGEAGILALDARGHGRTTLADGSNFSLSRLADDLVTLLKTVYPDRAKSPAFVLIGHSLGGAVVAEACGRVQAEVGDVTGLVNLDIVEGSALEALDQAKQYMERQPRGFATKEDAIRWHIETRTMRNPNSARVSVPGIIKENLGAASAMPPPAVPPPSDSPEVGPSPFPPPDPVAPSPGEFPLIWRTDLRMMGPYWEGWFRGLSSRFLRARTAKLLILAGTDRLDKEMMIAQMQGKFQLSVFADVGHHVQEDNPAKTATAVVEFWRRNERSTGDILKHVKKVGQL